MFCKNCGAQIDDKAEICIKCGVRIKELSVPTQKKDPWLATALSFLIIGLGQIYTIISFAFMMSSDPPFVFVLIALWVYGIYDAHNEAKKINTTKQQNAVT